MSARARQDPRARANASATRPSLLFAARNTRPPRVVPGAGAWATDAARSERARAPDDGGREERGRKGRLGAHALAAWRSRRRASRCCTARRRGAKQRHARRPHLVRLHVVGAVLELQLGEPEVVADGGRDGGHCGGGGAPQRRRERPGSTDALRAESQVPGTAVPGEGARAVPPARAHPRAARSVASVNTHPPEERRRRRPPQGARGAAEGGCLPPPPPPRRGHGWHRERHLQRRDLCRGGRGGRPGWGGPRALGWRSRWR